jgi:hypothetical protein
MKLGKAYEQRSGLKKMFIFPYKRNHSVFHANQHIGGVILIKKTNNILKIC